MIKCFIQIMYNEVCASRAEKDLALPAGKKKNFSSKNVGLSNIFMFIYTTLGAFEPNIMVSRVHLPIQQVGIKCSVHRKPFILYPLYVSANGL